MDGDIKLSWLKFRARLCGDTVMVVGTRSDNHEFSVCISDPTLTAEQLAGMATDLTDTFKTLDCAAHIHELTDHNPELEDSGRCDYKA